MSGADFLDGMARSSRERVELARALRPAAALRAAIARLPPPPPLVLSAAGFDLIAEMKLRSPALGPLRAAATEDAGARVREYAQAGAAAVSVLTEPSRFDGSLEHLEQAVAALAQARVPAMRKDFLVDPYQVLEARAAGASGVLVILRMLPRAELAALVDEALAQRLFVLLEAFDAELPRIMHKLRKGDLIILTADHGNDPTWTGTDHTREQIPVMSFMPGMIPGSFGLRTSFADIGQTIARQLDVGPLAAGTAWDVASPAA